MRCNVPFCTSDSLRHGQDISFFNFPKYPNIRKEWTKALGINWEPKHTNFLCSEHFREEDIYETKVGIRKLHDNAVPIKILHELHNHSSYSAKKHQPVNRLVADLTAQGALDYPDILSVLEALLMHPECFTFKDCDALAAQRVCRICLAIDTNMYDFAEFDQMFEQITGILTNEDEATRLPQRLCWECAARLKTAAAFRDKAFISDGLLHDLLKTSTQIKIRDIKTINRITNGLKTQLVQNVIDCEHYELNVKDTFVETVHDSDSDIEMQNDEKVEVLEPSTSTAKNKLDVVVEMPLKDIGTSNINEQDNNVDMLFEEFDHSDEDSDNEVVEKENKTEAELKEEGTDRYVIEVKEPVDKNIQNIYVTKIPVIKNNPNEMVFEDYSEDDVDIADKEDLDNQEEITAGDSNKEIVKVYEHVSINKYVTKLPANTIKKDKSGVRYHRFTKKEIKPIDETVFEIIPLSYNEQMKEFEARKESSWYKKAPYKCTVCYKAFIFQNSYNSHVFRHNPNNGAHECYICTKRLKTAQSLRTHLLARHTVQYNCRLCKFSTRHRHVALTHTKFHEGKKYKCSFCPKEFDILSTYFGHLRFKHTFDWVCHFCGYTFVSKNGLKQHKRLKHGNLDEATPLEGPHCDVCDVTFLSQQAHDTHLKVSSKHLQGELDPMRIRNAPRLYPARECQEQPSINTHRTRGPSKPVECEQCGIELQTYRRYAEHFENEHPGMTMAKKKKKYVLSPAMCEQCGKILRNASLLKLHMLVHSCKKPFICDYCNRGFTVKAYLVRHLELHDPTIKRKRVQCPICHKEFYSSSNLNKHLPIHSGLKPFQCHVCKKNFTTSYECRSHIQHVHLHMPWPRKKKRDNQKRKAESIED